MIAYMMLTPEWTYCVDKKPVMSINKICKRPYADEGYRLYKTLKEVAKDIRDWDMRDSIIVKVETISPVCKKIVRNGFSNKIVGRHYYADTVKVLQKISVFDALALINKGFGNTGYDNEGNYNYGRNNRGYLNSGKNNVGNCNTGSNNVGSYNTGGTNRGDHNFGDNNLGNCNMGSNNIGNNNSGYYNCGDKNMGYHNTGYANLGNFNKGYNNGGCFNKTDYSNGAFNTKIPKIYMFNKPSNWTLEDFLKSKAYTILTNLRIDEFITSEQVIVKSADDMTNKEKEACPEHTITNLCLLKIKSKKTIPQEKWNGLSDADKQTVLDLPNFDAKIFKTITGIDVNLPKASKTK